jgi:aquaporin Z
MGLTTIAIVYSPWGKRSGAHINPAVTLTFLRLGKTKAWDALFYICAQVIGAAAGVLVSATILGKAIADPSINYLVTVIGPMGTAAAFIAEAIMSAGLMTAILKLAGHPRWAKYTGIVAGCLVAVYIALEAPISGMSINPARTFGSAFVAGKWQGFWVYLVAPPLGMLAAAQYHLWRRNVIPCAKLHHQNRYRCIFCGAPGARAA